MSTRLLTRAERDELRALINGEFSGGVDAIAVALQCGRLLDALDAAEADSAELRDTLRRHGFQPCDITACNCNGWHQTGGFYARFNEIDEAVGEHDGETLLAAVQRMVKERADALAQRDRAEAELDAERKMRVEAEAAAARAESELASHERMSWETLGRPDGTHDTTNVQRLCEQFAEAKAERNAIEAKLAELTDAASEFYEAAYDDSIQKAMSSTDFVLRAMLGDAIAAARGGEA